MLDETIEVLTEQMIRDRFKGKNESYIISRQELYKFCIKLIKVVKEVYEE